MVNRSIRMNLRWSSPASGCIRAGRVTAHKRLDADEQPPAKCARLEVGDAQQNQQQNQQQQQKLRNQQQKLRNQQQNQQQQQQQLHGLLGSPPPTPPAAAVSKSSAGVPPPHQGPSRIGAFLLLPLADRESTHSAMNTDTGDELLCKVFNMGVYQEKIRAYGVLPSHRNVAGIRDIVLGERRAYVFLDKDFGDMHTLVKSCRRLDEERARGLFRQVAQAVAHCHQAGVVLGDLKLRKFVFADEKRTRVRLESLEDCRVLEDPNDDSMSDTHGCPAYVSPEILSGSAPYSGKMADMWSLGVMLYTMLVGRYPFHDPDPATLFSKIRRGQCCLPDGLSPKAKCLLQSLLRKEPWERLTAAELLTHPWFHQPPPSQEAAPGEQEVSSAEQMVPSFDAEEEDDLFC